MKKIIFIGVSIFVIFSTLIFTKKIVEYEQMTLHFTEQKDSSSYYEVGNRTIYLVNISSLTITYHNQTKELQDYMKEDDQFFEKMVKKLHLKNESENENEYLYQYENHISITNANTLEENDILISKLGSATSQVWVKELESNTDFYISQEGNVVKILVEKYDTFTPTTKMPQYELTVDGTIYGVYRTEKEIYLLKEGKEAKVNEKDYGKLCHLLDKYVQVEEKDIPLETKLQVGKLDESKTFYEVYIKDGIVYAKKENTEDLEKIIFDEEEVKGLAKQTTCCAGDGFLLLVTQSGNVYKSQQDCNYNFDFSITFEKLELTNIVGFKQRNYANLTSYFYAVDANGKRTLIEFF